MEIDGERAELGINKLPFAEPHRKRKLGPNRELTWEEKAVIVFHICFERLAKKYNGGCNIIPASFFDLQKQSKPDIQIGEMGVGVSCIEDDGGDSSVDEHGGSSSEEDGCLSSGDDGYSSSEDDGCSSSSEDDVGCSSVEGDYSDSSVHDDFWMEQHDDVGGSASEDDNFWSSVEQKLALLPEWLKCLERREHTDDEKAVEALNVVRLWQSTVYDPKKGYAVPTRFCKFNLSLFDFEKESTAGLSPPYTLTQSDSLVDSVNFVSVKILESDVGYPISVFGTIFARDQIDYKRVYLFKRFRDSPQVIKSPDDMLALTGPCRGLFVPSHMSIEVNLRIKCDDGDKDFSKGLIEHSGTNIVHTKKTVTRLLTSWMSTVQLIYTNVPHALEASIAINILKGPCGFFSGKVIAWTSGNQTRMILHDSQAEGTQTAIGAAGSIELSGSLVAVPVMESLALKIWVHGGDDEVACFSLTLGQSRDHDFICKEGFCELQVKVSWTSMVLTRRHKVFKQVGGVILVV